MIYWFLKCLQQSFPFGLKLVDCSLQFANLVFLQLKFGRCLNLLLSKLLQLRTSRFQLHTFALYF